MITLFVLCVLIIQSYNTVKEVTLVSEKTEIRTDYPSLTNSFQPWETKIDAQDLSNFYLSPAELSMFALCIFFGGLSVLLIYFEFIKPIKKSKKYLIMQNNENRNPDLNAKKETKLNLDSDIPTAKEVGVTKGVPLNLKEKKNDENNDW